MNKLISALALIGLVVVQACEGPIGPMGPQGIEGDPGINIVAEAFEVTANFTAQDNHQVVFDFEPAIVESDVVLAFIEWDKSDQKPIWRPLPQTVFFKEGVMVYNYDFTNTDFRLFLEGPLNLSLLGPEWLQNQKFRVVVVPADYTGARIDFTNYEAVIEMLGIQEADFKKVQLKQKKSA